MNSKAIILFRKSNFRRKQNNRKDIVIRVIRVIPAKLRTSEQSIKPTKLLDLSLVMYKSKQMLSSGRYN